MDRRPKLAKFGKMRRLVVLERLTMDYLSKILDQKHHEVAVAKAGATADLMRMRAEKAPKPRGFARALKSKVECGEPAVVAEIKRRTPDKGIICNNFYPSRIAREFESSGATCLAVFTDFQFYQGSAESLKAARAASQLPVLCEDFFIDPYQVIAARAMGADAVLLMLQFLEPEQAMSMCRLAQDFEMDVLAGVCSERDLEIAAQLPTEAVCISNRDYSDYSTDIQRSLELIEKAPQDRLLVSAGGIESPQEVSLIRSTGVNSFIIGEAFLRSGSPGRMLSRFFYPGKLA